MATTPASVGRHPLHSIVAAFPIALWGVSLGSDISYRVGGGNAIRNAVVFVPKVGVSQASEEPSREATRRRRAD